MFDALSFQFATKIEISESPKIISSCFSNGSFDGNLIVYGAGNIGRRFAKSMVGNVLAFADVDESKVGTTIDGIKVISLEEMKIKAHTATVVVASGINNTYSMIKTVQNFNIEHCLVYMGLWDWSNK